MISFSTVFAASTKVSSCEVNELPEPPPYVVMFAPRRDSTSLTTREAELDNPEAMDLMPSPRSGDFT